ncbi:MAG: ABC transporter ATP-binding protein [Chitinophagales bacterium]
MRSLFSLFQYFGRHRLRTISGFVFILLANLFKTYNPSVVRQAIDKVVGILKTQHSGSSEIPDQIFSASLWFILLYVGVALLEGLFTFLMRQTIIVVSRLIENDIKADMYAHYQQLDLAFYRKNNTGDLMNRITEDVSRVRMFLGPSLMYSANLVCMFVLCTVAMIRVNAELALYTLLPLPFLSLLIYLLNYRIEKASDSLQKKLSDITTNAQESYSGIRVIQNYVQEKAMIGFFSRESESYKKDSLQLARIESFYFPLILFLVGLCMAIIVYTGGRLVMAHQVSIGNIVEFIMYLNMLTFPVSALGWAVSLTQRAAVSMRRINEFFHQQPTVWNSNGERKEMKGTISFHEVDFVYPDTGIRALKKVSFTIPAGERWALIGRTGSGKSTVADLLMRMYDVTGGSITIDGLDIRQWETGALRRQIGYVPQDVFLFSETIADNIAFGLSDTNLEEVKKYAGYASVAAEIDRFPQGYDTMVGERGVTLSGGQKQRISIARALIKKPAVLLLDDCLSAVDAATEKEIERNLDEVIRGKTSLVITHRIFALMHFHRILVIDDGEIAEQGTPDELMGKNGIYAGIFRKQMLERAERNAVYQGNLDN